MIVEVLMIAARGKRRRSIGHVEYSMAGAFPFKSAIASRIGRLWQPYPRYELRESYDRPARKSRGEK